VSEHDSYWKAAYLLCHGVQILQLRQAAEAKVCMRVHDHGEPLVKKPHSRIMNGDYAVLTTHRFI